jgi:hypothetical protein
MATEADELRLTVTLVDNASAGLRNLQQSMQQIGGGQASDNMNRFRRSVDEVQRGFAPFLATMEKAAKSVVPEFVTGIRSGTAAFAAFGVGAGGLVIGLAALGLGLKKVVDSLSPLSAKLVELGHVAERTQMPAAQIREMGEAYERAGSNAAEATQDITGFTEAQVDLTRVFSKVREEALKGIPSMNARQKEEMELLLGRMPRESAQQGMQDLQRINEFVKRNAEEAARRRFPGLDPQVAKAAGEEAVRNFDSQIFHVNNLWKLKEQIRITDDEENKRAQQRIDDAKEFWRLTTLIGQEWTHIKDDIGGLAIATLVPVLAGVEKAVKLVSTAVDDATAKLRNLWELIGIGPNAPAAPHEKSQLFKQMAPQPPAAATSGTPTGDLLRKMYGDYPVLGAPHQHGGIVTRDMYAMLHAGETVTPAHGVSSIEEQTKVTKELTGEMKKLVNYLTLPGNMRMSGLSNPMGDLPGWGATGSAWGASGGRVPYGSRNPAVAAQIQRLTGEPERVGPGTGPGADENVPGPAGVSGAWGASTGRVPYDLRSMGALAQAQRITGEPVRRGGGGGGAAGDEGDLSRAAYDKMFSGTPLGGEYENVVAAAKANNVPPSVMAAVMAEETGRGKSHLLATRLNPAGIFQHGKYTSFPSIGEGISAAGQAIGRNYARGGGTIAGMARTYAPVGARNDPGGTNRQWPGAVTKFQHQLSAPTTAAGAPPGMPPQSNAVPSHFQSDLEAMTLAGAKPHNIHAYMMAHGINLSEATCGQFMASVVKEHGGIPPRDPAVASNWNNFGGVGGAGYSSDPNAINIAVRQGTGVGSTGSHVTGAVPIKNASGEIIGFRGVGANQFNPEGPEHGVGQYGRDVVSSRPITIGTRPGQYQIRHQILDSAVADRTGIDRGMTHTVTGSADLNVSVNAPRGTRVDAGAKGLFKRVSVNRQQQMEPAASSLAQMQE